MARQINSENSYRDILVKLIPSETIAAFVAIQSSLSNTREISPWIIWGIPVVLLASIPFHLRLLYKVINTTQIVCTMMSFAVWAFSLGGLERKNSVYGGIALVLWTMVIPYFMVRKTTICKGDVVKIIGKKPTEDINRPSCNIEWNADMTEFCSKPAVVVSINSKENWAKLDIDGSENDWAFEWLILVKETQIKT